MTFEWEGDPHMTIRVAGSESRQREIEFAIGGMTCASCAARIERKLNKMDGVSATVNYATEKARVSYADAVSPEDLVAAVEATGYTATLPPAETSDTEPAAAEPTTAEPDDAAPSWRHTSGRCGRCCSPPPA